MHGAISKLNFDTSDVPAFCALLIAMAFPEAPVNCLWPMVLQLQACDMVCTFANAAN